LDDHGDYYDKGKAFGDFIAGFVFHVMSKLLNGSGNQDVLGKSVNDILIVGDFQGYLIGAGFGECV
jgi:hypothetical protein